MDDALDTGPEPEEDNRVDLTDAAIAQAARWLELADQASTRADRETNRRLHAVVSEADGVVFAMRYVDRVSRPEDARVAARQLSALIRSDGAPGFLSRSDRLLLRAGARLAPLMPRLVMPLAGRRMRSMVGSLVVDADARHLSDHLAGRRAEGFDINVNLLGEAVLGEREAGRRHAESMALLDHRDVDYVSVKISSIVSQLSHWDHDGSVERVVDALRPLVVQATTTDPPTFVNLDMEEYHDVELTAQSFMRLLDETSLHTANAGIVLQAYLPGSFTALQELVEWATARRRRQVDGQPGGTVKIRLVKGANLAMERVDAALHGWEQAPYATKAETDANYKRCLDWVLTTERTRGVRIGVASHNLFDVSWARLLSVRRGVADRVEFEMLQGMAPAQARVTRDETGSLLLYTPAVAREDFDVAISYLFRRLEENASNENFIRHLFHLRSESAEFAAEAAKFRAAVDDRWNVAVQPRRTQNRLQPTEPDRPGDRLGTFHNEPESDPSIRANRTWARAVIEQPFDGPTAVVSHAPADIDRAVAEVARAQPAWATRRAADRRGVLHAIADEASRRRGDLISAMVHEAHKTFEQADIEVCEAIDFARWYGDRSTDLERDDDRHDDDRAEFAPLGVVAVAPPWNFPVAIPAGGTLAALAAGNGVVLKPAPQTPRCAEIVAECCWRAGVPDDVLRFVRTGDDEAGKRLISHPDVAAVILTGAYETAEVFRTWRPDLALFAETSGKNSMIITPNADLDLAVADLVSSAFGHSGQKCSAASVAICVGDVYHSNRFRRQLVDAVRSIRVGPATDLATTMGPLIATPTGKLLRALTRLEPGEEWLVEPLRIGEHTWTPGVRAGVASGSWFHRTECFGPVLGLMSARDLDEAIELQNATPYGLTGGIHSLDPDEIGEWLERVEVGNAYVNRATTGAIVRRQPFGGWNRSSVGPGAKAGGPNYVAQLGTWTDRRGDLPDDRWLAVAAASDERAWRHEFSVEHDPTQLFCEANVVRYRPLDRIAVRVEADGRAVETARVLAAAERCGVEVVMSDNRAESTGSFAARLPTLGVARVRVLGTVTAPLRLAANDSAVHLADAPVTCDGRVELLHYLREQSVSRTLHRYGNLVT